MDIAQFFTSADLYGIAPEIILTITALSVLTLEMFHVFRSKIILMVAALGLLLASSVVINTINGFFSEGCWSSAGIQHFLILFIFSLGL